ncbi:MAG: hypothetical protein WAT20_05860 [Ferruginibacter sp.]|nr:hypothetical protein [Chitinophagaceae bacterium]
MKTLLKLFVFASAIILIAISCKKMLSNEDQPASGKTFNTAFVKNWYYGTFIKTAEWSAAAEKDKQLPDWKNGVITTIDKLDAVVYPFIKGKHTFSLPGANALTDPQGKRIAAASLSTIAFIKTADNKIAVREIDYIPDWQYLQRKQFDMGDMKGVNGKSDFSGMVITKDWAGKILSLHTQVEGKTVKYGRIVKEKKSGNTKNGDNTSSLGECTYTTFCLWQQDCVLIIHGDGMIENECGAWYIVECWEVENCPDPPPGGGGGGGGGPIEPPACDPNAVWPEEEQFNNYVVMQSASEVSINANTSPDGQDPITNSFVWNVAEAEYGGWTVKANTNYSYFHDKYFDVNLNAFIHTYNLFVFATGNGYFVGSNFTITSTYTTTNPTVNQVINNNTSNTQGKSHVTGTLNHVLNIQIRIPYCDPLTLSSVDQIDNSMVFNPR